MAKEAEKKYSGKRGVVFVNEYRFTRRDRRWWFDDSYSRGFVEQGLDGVRSWSLQRHYYALRFLSLLRVGIPKEINEVSSIYLTI